MILDSVEFDDAKIRLSTESDLGKIRKEFANPRERERFRYSNTRTEECKGFAALRRRFSYSRQSIHDYDEPRLQNADEVAGERGNPRDW